MAGKVVFGLLLLVVVTAQVGAPCGDAHPCETGYRCNAGFCAAACSSDSCASTPATPVCVPATVTCSPNTPNCGQFVCKPSCDGIAPTTCADGTVKTPTSTNDCRVECPTFVSCNQQTPCTDGVCVDNLSGCAPNCDGICQPPPAGACPTDVLTCADGSTYHRNPAANCDFSPRCPEPDACALVNCGTTGRCDPSTGYCVANVVCAGASGSGCDGGATCVDNTNDDCNPATSTVPCAGICQAPPACRDETLHCSTGETFTPDPAHNCALGPCPARQFCDTNTCTDANTRCDNVAQRCVPTSCPTGFTCNMQCDLGLGRTDTGCPKCECATTNTAPTCTDKSCATGSRCDTSTGRCVPMSCGGTTGQSCPEHFSCVEGICKQLPVCDTDVKTCSDGTTRARDPTNNCAYYGPDCPATSGCLALNCVDGQSCNTATGQCAPNTCPELTCLVSADCVRTRDANGCFTCNCQVLTCDQIVCGLGQTCNPNTKKCVATTCDCTNACTDAQRCVTKTNGPVCEGGVCYYFDCVSATCPNVDSRTCDGGIILHPDPANNCAIGDCPTTGTGNTGTTCANGKAPVDCTNKNPCERQTCATPNAVCTKNACDSCSALWIDVYGNAVDCLLHVTGGTVTVQFTGDNAKYFLEHERDVEAGLLQDCATAAGVNVDSLTVSTVVNNDDRTVVTITILYTPTDGSLTAEQAIANFNAEYQSEGSGLRNGDASGKLDYNYGTTSQAVALVQCNDGTWQETCSGAAQLAASLFVVLLSMFLSKML